MLHLLNEFETDAFARLRKCNIYPTISTLTRAHLFVIVNVPNLKYTIRKPFASLRRRPWMLVVADQRKHKLRHKRIKRLLCNAAAAVVAD